MKCPYNNKGQCTFMGSCNFQDDSGTPEIPIISCELKDDTPVTTKLGLITFSWYFVRFLLLVIVITFLLVFGGAL